MSTIPLIIITLLYLLSSADLFYKKQYGMGVVFLSYATANLGLMYSSFQIQSQP